MIPRKSLWGFLTAEGRLQNLWAGGLQQPDRERGLQMLREVMRCLTGSPQKYGQYWVPFLDGFLSDDFVRLLTAQDLADVDAMAETAANLRLAATTAVEIHRRLVKAFDARREPDLAIAALTKICTGADTPTDAKLQAARDLAKHGAQGEPQLKIYVQFLKASRSIEKETEIARILERVCAVTFQSNEAELRRAFDVAQELIRAKLAIPGVNTAFGVFLLKNRREAKQAAAHFEVAFKKNAQDDTALAGWLGARAQCGDYDLPAAASRRAKASVDPVVAGLIRLIYALEWIDVQNLKGDPPTKAADLWEAKLEPYAGESVSVACGCLYLFEGEANRAVPLLAGLASDHPEEPRWRCFHEWACALLETNEAQKLEHLRKALRDLKSHPGRFAAVWLRFLDLYLEAPRLPQLGLLDFEAVEQMAEALDSMPAPPIQSYKIWRRLLAARDSRGEPNAGSDMLVKIYKSATASVEIKAECATNLAQRQARDQGALEVYVEHLNRARAPTKEKAILALLADVCVADFLTPGEQLEAKAAIAAKLTGKVKGAERVVALACLCLPPHKPERAAEFFRAALVADEHDDVALAGFLMACGEAGMYAAAGQWAEKAHGRPLAEKALRLTKSLQWLDEPWSGATPEAAAAVEALAIGAGVADVIAMAAGRLYLVEGDAGRAHAILGRLADRRFGRWNYWAAWASILSGRAKEVVQRFEAASQWTERWTIACMLLDVDPRQRAQGPEWATSAAAARLQLATTGESGKKGWHQGKEALEPELEIMRTALGQAFAVRDAEEFAQIAAGPLFRRLPAADQRLWAGLGEILGGEAQQGRALLEEALRLGHPRAALILAVLHLEAGRADLAGPLLERGAGVRPNPKARLLGAYLHSRQGRLRQAHDQLAELAKEEVQGADKSERAARLRETRIHYAQGYLFLRLADEARSTGNTKSAQSWRDEAVSVFEAALKDRGALPPDCEIAALCASLLAAPDKQGRPGAESFDLLDRVPAARKGEWMVWLTALAVLWSDDPERSAAAVELLEEVCESGSSLAVPVAEVLAQQAARACLRARRPEHKEALVRLFDQLAAGGEKTTAFRRVAIAAAARARYEQTSEGDRAQAVRQVRRLLEADSTNGSLALLAAKAEIEGSDGASRAGAILASVRPMGPEEKFCRALAGVLGSLGSQDGVWQESLSAGAPPELVQIWNVVRAAVAFAAAQPEAGYEAILAALGGPSKEVTELMDLSRALPALCAVSLKRRSVPRALADTLRRLTSAAVDPGDRRMLARCAAAIGESDTACALWEQAASGEQADEAREEFARYLSYLAVQARVRRNDEDALRFLRRAAGMG